ncbi:MAG: hypothetical protein P8X51_14560 [Maritimibacter sp.]
MFDTADASESETFLRFLMQPARPQFETACSNTNVSWRIGAVSNPDHFSIHFQPDEPISLLRTESPCSKRNPDGRRRCREKAPPTVSNERNSAMSQAFYFPPRLMQATAAAHYVGISVSKLYTLGLPRKMDGRNRLFEIRDLDRYIDALPYEDGSTTDGISVADAAFAE